MAPTPEMPKPEGSDAEFLIKHVLITKYNVMRPNCKLEGSEWQEVVRSYAAKVALMARPKKGRPVTIGMRSPALLSFLDGLALKGIDEMGLAEGVEWVIRRIETS
jgi:hypothetical protein